MSPIPTETDKYRIHSIRIMEDKCNTIEVIYECKREAGVMRMLWLDTLLDLGLRLKVLCP